MSGKAQAVRSGKELEQAVAALGRHLGLEVRRQVVIGKRLWGAKRTIDIVLTYPIAQKSIGIECKVQARPGSAEEKIPATIADIQSWPMHGIVVFSGAGFSDHMRAYLYSTGLAVDLDDLPGWLGMYFGIN